MMAPRAAPTRGLSPSVLLLSCSSACQLIAGLDGTRDLAAATQGGGEAGLHASGQAGATTAGEAGKGGGGGAGRGG
ncbi:MAG TPA: hypothetical protein VGK73_38250, partial [Polyangiaceae bacterium]